MAARIAGKSERLVIPCLDCLPGRTFCIRRETRSHDVEQGERFGSHNTLIYSQVQYRDREQSLHHDEQ